MRGGLVRTKGPEIADEIWRELRNDASAQARSVAVAELSMLCRLGYLTVSDTQARIKALEQCPGHDDEGGRAWCAYGCDLGAIQ